VASIGQLHAKADVFGRADDNISVDAHAFAETADHIMMIVPGILPFGARVTVHVPLKISGFPLAQKSVSNPFASSFAKAFAGYTAIALATEIDGTFIRVAFVDGHAVAPDDFSVGDDTPPSPEFTLDMDVRANQFFQITLRMETTAHFEFNDNSLFQSVSGSGNAVASFQNSLVWGGIRSVTDPVTGLPIEGWSVISRSGADYSKSFEVVPEPSSVLLLGIAPCSWLRRARTRVWRAGS
jgi:hypothetical protein